MCQFPIKIQNKERLTWDDPARIDVPCGKCSRCLKRRLQDWTFRLKQEAKHSSSCHFITLTYNDQFIPQNEEYYTLHKPDLQKFLKRLRKREKKTLKYYAVGEYGTYYQRPHYHLLLFNLTDPGNIDLSWSKRGVSMGFTETEPLRHDGGIGYLVNYFATTHDSQDKRDKEFHLMSKGLGKAYLTPQIIDWHQSDLSRIYCVNPGGFKQPLPRYYKDKLYQWQWQRDWQKDYIDDMLFTKQEKEVQELLQKGYPKRSYVDDKGVFHHSAELVLALREMNAKHMKSTKKIKI